MSKRRGNEIKRRAFAIWMSALMFFSVIDTGGWNLLSADAAEEGNEIRITAFAQLDQEIMVQTLAQGASENEICFPDTLTVTVEKKADAGSSESTTSEGDISEDHIQEDIIPEDGLEPGNTVNGENGDGGNNGDDGNNDAGGSNDDRQNDTQSGSLEDTGSVPAVITRQECTLTDVTWVLDASESDSEAFDSSVNGSAYVYAPLLPQMDENGNAYVLADGVEAPRVYVLIGESEIALFSEDNGAYGTELESGTTGDCTYTVYSTKNDNTGDLLVISGTGGMADYGMDSYTGIWSNAPWMENYRASLAKMVVEYGVTRIGGDNLTVNDAIRGLQRTDNPVSVEIQTDAQGKTTLTEIGRRAFYYANLSTINLPEGLKTIEDSAFRASTLGQFLIPSTVTVIGSDALKDKTVYYLCTGANVTNNPANSAYMIKTEVDGVSTGARYVLPTDVASGTIYEGTKWDAATGFPSALISEEAPYTWQDAGGNSYTVDAQAVLTGDATFRRYNYEVRTVLFQLTHATTSGKTDGSEAAKGGASGEDYTCTLTAYENYHPLTKDDIIIKVGETPLDQQDYSFDNGILTIKKEALTDTVDITVSARPDESKYTVCITKDGITTFYMDPDDAMNVVAGYGYPAGCEITLLKDATLDGIGEEKNSYAQPYQVRCSLTMDLKQAALTFENNVFYQIISGSSTIKNGRLVSKNNSRYIIYGIGGSLTLENLNVEDTAGTTEMIISQGSELIIRGGCYKKTNEESYIVAMSGWNSVIEEAEFYGDVAVIPGVHISNGIFHNKLCALEGSTANLAEILEEGTAVRSNADGTYYARAQLAVTEISDVEVLLCTQHSVVDDHCQWCNKEVASHEGEHSFDAMTGACTYPGCRIVRCGMIELDGRQTFYKNWSDLCGAAADFTEGSTATIRIYQDMNVESTMELSAGTVMLDLNGHTLESVAGTVLLRISAAAVVTVDNGTLKGTEYVIEVSDGTLTAESGLTIIGNTNNESVKHCIFNNEGTVIINGGCYIGAYALYHINTASSSLTIAGGTFTGTVSIHYRQGVENNVTLKAGTYGQLVLILDSQNESLDRCFSDMLAEGYAFRSAKAENDWLTGDAVGSGVTVLSDVKVEQIPVRITGQPQGKEVYHGETETLSITAQALTGSQSITYEWYSEGTGENGADEKLAGTTDCLTLPEDLEVGNTYRYYCNVTCDGYTLRSDSAEVKVYGRIADTIQAGDIVFDTDYRNGYAYYVSEDIFAYGGGTAIEPAFTIRNTTLTQDVDYTVSYENNTAVGTATMHIMGKGNYAGSLDKSFEIVIPEYDMETVVQNPDTAVIQTMSKGTDGVYELPDVYYSTACVKLAFRSQTEEAVCASGYTDASWNTDYIVNAPAGQKGTVEEKIYVRVNGGEHQGYYIASVRVNFDRIAPVFGENDGISLCDYRFNTMLDAITFGVLGNVRTEVTISATDEESGIDRYYYYVDTVAQEDKDSYQVLTSEQLTAVAFTEAVNGRLLLSDGGNKVVYAYATDRAGNRSAYICSDGVVIDDAAPVLTLTPPSGERLTDITAGVLLNSNEEGSYDYIVSTVSLTIPDLEALKENEYYHSSNTGTITSGQVGSDIEISLNGLSANTHYYFYVIATDLVKNESAAACVEFTTDKTHPYVAASPAVSGSYGTRVENMTVTGGEVRTKLGGEVLTGTWEVSDENGSDMPGVADTTAYEVKFTPDDSSYAQITVKVITRVEKKKVTVVIADAHRAYGEDNPVFTAALKPGETLVGSDAYEDLGITLTTTATKASDVRTGGYPVMGACNSANYTVIFEGESGGTDGILTIMQAQNEFLQSLTCEDYIYTGTKMPSPAATARFGEVTYRYAVRNSSAEPEESEYTSVAPTTAGMYCVKAYVAQTDNYTGLTSAAVSFRIEMAYEVPNTPSEEMRAESRYGVVGNVLLPQGWIWQESDRNTELIVGETVQATAIYTAADKDNYVKTSVLISITCYRCTHEKTEIRYAAGADCEHTGYSGDTCCVECGLRIGVGNTINALGHQYTAAVTKEPTSTQQGVRTYTCTRCHASYTETIEKLSQTQDQENPAGQDQTGETQNGQDQNGQNHPGSNGNNGSKNEQESTRTENDSLQNPEEPVEETTNAESGRPFISGDSEKSGWDIILESARQAEDTDCIRVDMNGSTVVPGEIFETIQDRNVEIVFDMGNGIAWTVNGMDVIQPAGDIDFGVKLGMDAGNTIPVEVINNVTGERYYRNMSLVYEGEFGFKAVLSVNMDSANAGLYANLFYYNEQTGGLEFICADQIAEDGSVELIFTHASEYTIVINETSMEDDASAGDAADAGTEEHADTEKDSMETIQTKAAAGNGVPVYLWIVLIAAAVIVIAGVLLLTGKKRNRKQS